MRLDLSVDQVLSTTRSVRKRLDLEREVDPALVRECIELALQAPTGSNMQNWHFIVVTDPAKRAALADIYRKGWALYTTLGDTNPGVAAANASGDDDRMAQMNRVYGSAAYLADHLERVPVHIIPAMWGRPEGLPHFAQASIFGSVAPAAWSLMLAARERGLGTCWTTIHLMHEAEAAEVLGIPFDKVAQLALIPLAHTIGTEFRPATRTNFDQVVHWDGW